MDANSKSITFALAATLLLAIAANANPDIESAESDYKFLFTDKRTVTVWFAEPECDSYDKSALRANKYSDIPKVMLQQLRDKLNAYRRWRLSGIGEHRIQRLIAYVGSDCDQIHLWEFINLFTSCGGLDEFKCYANFVKKYAPVKFQLCARNFIKDLDKKVDVIFEEYLNKLQEFFRAALGIEDKLSDEQMHDRIREFDLTKGRFDVQAMIKVGNKYRYWYEKSLSDLDNMVHKFHLACAQFGTWIIKKVNLINVARGLGVIEEKELSPRFHLVNAYIRFYVQIDHEVIFDAMCKHLTDTYEASESSRLKNSCKDTSCFSE